jgi:hypothetical protein
MGGSPHFAGVSLPILGYVCWLHENAAADYAPAGFTIERRRPMSLEIKDLGGGGFTITCGEESVVVVGSVSKVTTRAKVEATAAPAGTILEYLTVPVGPVGKGKSRLTFVCPGLPGSKQRELDDLVVQLEDHPQWSEVLGKMATLTGTGPLMVVKGLGKKKL